MSSTYDKLLAYGSTYATSKTSYATGGGLMVPKLVSGDTRQGFETNEYIKYIKC